MRTKICMAWISETWIETGTYRFHFKKLLYSSLNDVSLCKKRSYVNFSWETLRKGKVVPEIHVQAWVVCLRNAGPVERTQGSTVRVSRAYPAKCDVRKDWIRHCLLAFPNRSVIFSSFPSLISLSREIISCSMLPFMRTFSWPCCFWCAFSLNKVEQGRTCWRLPMELKSPEFD